MQLSVASALLPGPYNLKIIHTDNDAALGAMHALCQMEIPAAGQNAANHRKSLQEKDLRRQIKPSLFLTTRSRNITASRTGRQSLVFAQIVSSVATAGQLLRCPELSSNGARIRWAPYYRVGGGIAPAVLPHHRTYGSVYGGSSLTGDSVRDICGQG